MTELVQHQPQQSSSEVSLQDQMNYAQAIANSPILPQAYRGNPASALIAIGLGQSMGLSPAESLYRIDVIQGKPTASAELIASNVRKAGHKLRVRGDERSCTATIIRADDPDFPFEVTRDTEWAKGMGLLSKDNYKKQPGTMLQWRAVTAVARLACPEALYGVAYTPDEMTDFDRPKAEPRRGGFGIAANMPTQVPRQEDEVIEVVHQDDTPAPAPETPEPAEPVTPEPSTRSQWIRLGNALDAVGITEKADKTDAIVSWATSQGVQDVASAKDLTAAQIEDLIAELANDPDAQHTDAQEVPQS